MKEMRVILPSIERPKKLPVGLSQREIKQLLKTPKLLKHRLVLALLYGCGLRNFELRNLQRRDLDFDRKMLHVRQGKGRKDRYVPLSGMHIRGLKEYFLAENPTIWCFNGNDIEGKPVQLFSFGIPLCLRASRTIHWMPWEESWTGFPSISLPLKHQMVGFSARKYSFRPRICIPDRGT